MVVCEVQPRASQIQPPRYNNTALDWRRSVLRDAAGTVFVLRPFPGECCFQVIYFVANIFSSPLAE
jgi:hypothetical protein